MATEDLLQPGHVVKERWKVVRKYNSWPLSLFLSQFLLRFVAMCPVDHRRDVSQTGG